MDEVEQLMKAYESQPAPSVESKLGVLIDLEGLRDPRIVPFLQVVSDRSSPDLRLQASLALAEFTDIAGVPTRLGRLALDSDEPIDLRYSAFTSLQRAGSTPECVTLLRELTTDEMLGHSARSLLSLWRLE
jgi:hypothetical protein